MIERSRNYPVPGGTFHHREGIEFPDDFTMMPKRGKGCYLWSESGEKYLDYMMGSGPMVLGHAHPSIVKAIQDRAELGTAFYKTDRTGLELAKRIVDAVPCADGLKFTSSGGEATYFALRLARAHTNKTKIVKFQGAYHGFHDAVMRSSDKRNPMDVLNAGYPGGTVDSTGTVEGVTKETIVAPYNNLDATQQILNSHADAIAAIIVEPVMRSLPATPEFLSGLRDVCDEHDIVLIFDEIVTGFRLAMGGAQETYGVKPDIATYGKAIGSGTPIGAVCGSEEILRHSDPKNAPGDVGAYISGTLSGNSLSVAAGHATLDILEQGDVFSQIRDYGENFKKIVDDLLNDSSLSGFTTGAGGVVDYVFAEPNADPTQWETIAKSDHDTKRMIDLDLLDNNIFQHVGGKKYISVMHGSDELELTENAYKSAFEGIA